MPPKPVLVVGQQKLNVSTHNTHFWVTDLLHRFSLAKLFSVIPRRFEGNDTQVEYGTHGERMVVSVFPVSRSAC